MSDMKEGRKQVAFSVTTEFYDELVRFAKTEDLTLATYVRLCVQDKIRKERERERELSKK